MAGFCAGFFSRANSDSERTYDYGVPYELHLSQHVAPGTGLPGTDHPWMKDLLFSLRAQGFCT